MAQSYAFRTSHPLVNPHMVAERLAIWSEQARLAGRVERADRLLVAAWTAYDLPSTVAEERELPAEMFPSGRDAVYSGKSLGGHGDWQRTLGRRERGMSTGD